jgi:hypothetical protein
MTPRHCSSGLELEHLDRRAKGLGLFGHRLRGGRRLLDERRVLLRDFVHLTHGHVDLFDAHRLIVTGGRDVGDDARHSAHGEIALHFSQRRKQLADLVGAERECLSTGRS